MALDQRIARLSKILVDSESISFDEAQARLRAQTLEIVVGPEAVSPASHAAILTAVSVGSRTFVGGVRVTGAVNMRLNSVLPLDADTLADAAEMVGASDFCYATSRKIVVGMDGGPTETWSVSPWWDGWKAGTTKSGEAHWGSGENPLPGIAAGALAVGIAFEAERKRFFDYRSEVDLWPVNTGMDAPYFENVFLPEALWLVGLGNLGQAYLWALSSLPFTDPSKVSLVLQDRDTVSKENWATSVLTKNGTYGSLKTKVAEDWTVAKGFKPRRVDRSLFARDRLENDDPRLALSGVDKYESRRNMAKVGFDCIVDAGLGRTASNFDRYRVTIFDQTRPIDKHFAGQVDIPVAQFQHTGDAYRLLEDEIGSCGMAEIGGSSVAVPYVSALAASVAISRVIAITSACEIPVNEVRQISNISSPKIAKLTSINCRGIGHAGNPAL